MAFAVVLTTAMARLSGARFGRWYWAGLQAGVTAGAVFTIRSCSQALVSIYILCLYCMNVWRAMIPLTTLLAVRHLAHGIIPPHPASSASPPNGPGRCWPSPTSQWPPRCSCFFTAFIGL